MLSQYNDYGQNNNPEETDETEEKKMSRNAIQSQMAILESDLRKKLAQKESLEMQIKREEKEQERMLMAIDDKKSQIKKIDFESLELEREIKRMKKKMNDTFSNNN